MYISEPNTERANIKAALVPDLGHESKVHHSHVTKMRVATVDIDSSQDRPNDCGKFLALDDSGSKTS